jgi:hypothetical protein
MTDETRDSPFGKHKMATPKILQGHSWTDDLGQLCRDSNDELKIRKWFIVHENPKLCVCTGVQNFVDNKPSQSYLNVPITCYLLSWLSVSCVF